MKKLLCLLLVISFLAACSSYGDKYKVNEKSEVYYKDGMTSDDAKRLGDFLLKNGYFDSTSEKSVQLAKENDSIAVKFVVDKTKVSQTEGADALFLIMGSAISSEVFMGKPLKIILADAYMKGFKNVPIPGAAAADTTK